MDDDPFPGTSSSTSAPDCLTAPCFCLFLFHCGLQLQHPGNLCTGCCCCCRGACSAARQLTKTNAKTSQLLPGGWLWAQEAFGLKGSRIFYEQSTNLEHQYLRRLFNLQILVKINIWLIVDTDGMGKVIQALCLQGYSSLLKQSIDHKEWVSLRERFFKKYSGDVTWINIYFTSTVIVCACTNRYAHL